MYSNVGSGLQCIQFYNMKKGFEKCKKNQIGMLDS